MKSKYLLQKIFILTFLFFSIGNIKPAVANFFSEKMLSQSITVTPKSTNENNNNLFAILLIGGFGFTLGVSVAFVFYRRNSSTTDKRNTQPNPSKNIIKTPIQTSSEQQKTSSQILYIEKAYNNLEQGDIEGALKIFNEAIDKQPGNAKIYGERAYFRKNKLGDKEGAIADYTQAININPDNALFYFCRSQTYLELGNRKKAMEDYNKGMNIAPENMAILNDS